MNCHRMVIDNQHFMKPTYITMLRFWLILTSLCTLQLSAATPTAAETLQSKSSPPNVITDDQGYGDLAEKHPEVVAELRAIYDKHWKSIAPQIQPGRLDLGNPAENPTLFCSQDWYLPVGNPP